MKRKHPRPPKYLRDFYDIPPRQWLRWLRFEARVKQLAAQGFGPLNEFFHRCMKDRRVRTSGFTRASMHSTSSSTSLDLFEWASFSRSSHEYLGVSISLTREFAGSDFRTVAEASCG